MHACYTDTRALSSTTQTHARDVYMLRLYSVKFNFSCTTVTIRRPKGKISARSWTVPQVKSIFTFEHYIFPIKQTLRRSCHGLNYIGPPRRTKFKPVGWGRSHDNKRSR